MLMKNLKSLKVVAAVLIAFAMFAAPALAAGQDLTVGKFLIEIAKVKQLDAVDAAAARTALANAGIIIGDMDLNKNLTQGDVVRISSAIGLTLSTSTPEVAFTADEMVVYINTFGPDLDADDSGNNPHAHGKPPYFDPHEKGQHKGHTKRSPSEPI
jgi:hypothetical protein